MMVHCIRKLNILSYLKAMFYILFQRIIMIPVANQICPIETYKLPNFKNPNIGEDFSIRLFGKFRKTNE